MISLTFDNAADLELISRLLLTQWQGLARKRVVFTMDELNAIDKAIADATTAAHERAVKALRQIALGDVYKDLDGRQVTTTYSGSQCAEIAVEALELIGGLEDI